KENELPWLRLDRLDLTHQSKRSEGSEQQNSAHIKRQGKPLYAPFDGGWPRPLHCRRALEPGPASVDQIISHVSGAMSVALFPGAAFGELDRFLSHFRFGETAVPGDRLDRMAIAIARGEIHPGVNCGRVGAQCLIDQTH